VTIVELYDLAGQVRQAEYDVVTLMPGGWLSCVIRGRNGEADVRIEYPPHRVYAVQRTHPV
jgi:hypothetical protein